jgi:hypothetical protein
MITCSPSLDSTVLSVGFFLSVHNSSGLKFFLRQESGLFPADRFGKSSRLLISPAWVTCPVLNQSLGPGICLAPVV